MDVKDKNIVSALDKTIDKFFKNNKNELIPYSKMLESNQSTALIINFPKNTHENIRYQVFDQYGIFDKLD